MKNEKIPTHLLLGTLGAGKTTTVLELLRQVPSGERWAVFVNELGVVGLDGALIDGEGKDTGRLVVHEAVGGCICCSAQADLESGIQAIAREVRPDRLIIEPTGLADAENLVRQLEDQGPSWGISLHSVIGHIDVRLCRDERFLEVPFWNNLIKLSDDIIGTKADKSSEEIVATFRKVISSKGSGLRSLHVGRETFLAMEWRTSCYAPPPTFSLAGEAEAVMPNSPHHHHPEVVQRTEILQGRGVCLEAVGKGHYTLGWIFDPDIVLPKEGIEKWLQSCRNRPFPPIRLKGVLHTDRGWCLLQLVNGDEPELTPAAARKDNRMELIASTDSGGWRDFEKLVPQVPGNKAGC